MYITEVATGFRKPVVIRKVVARDYAVLTKSRFSFSWKSFKDVTEIYKLCLEESNIILGAIGLIDWESEKRTEIKLLASARENVGSRKIYDGIAGCLIAYACREAIFKYGAHACVSLVPKTELIGHYMRKYHMRYAGWQLYLEEKELTIILKEYEA